MKNIDFINNAVSQRLSINEKIVKSVNKFYWSQGVRKKLSSLESDAVCVKGFTTFAVSKYNLNKKIKSVIGQIRNVRKSPKFKETTREIYLEKLFGNLRKLLERRNSLAKLYNNESNIGIPKPDTQSIEECRQDIGSGGNES